MRPFEILKNENLLNWHTVAIGYKRGWCEKSEIIKYAEDCVLLSKEEIKYPLVDIVTGENIDDAKFEILLNDISKEKVFFGDMEAFFLRWRYAFLVSIIKNDSSNHEKELLIEDIYAEFEHPEDMANLSVYSDCGVDAVEGAKSLIGELHDKIIENSEAPLLNGATFLHSGSWCPASRCPAK